MSDEPGRMEKAVLADLERWGAKVAGTALAVSALDLAHRLDTLGLHVQPAAASMLHTQLRATLLELAEIAPAAAENDEIDELNRKRNERRGA